MKYEVYVRKSSESKEKQALSIQSQKDSIQKQFPDVNIVDWIDEEKSAFKPYNRPKFADMMKRVHEGKIDGIIAWHPDRLSRNEIDAANITYALRSGILKDLKFASYSFSNSPEGIQQLQTSLSSSQYYSAKLGVDVKRGLGDKLEMGRMPGLAPLGYLNTKLATRGENKIVEDPERFNIIRKMWDLILTGNYSAPQIRIIATKEWGLLTQSKKKTGGKPIGYTTVYNMFSNLFYTGNFIYKGIMYKGDHKPMITMAEFDRVQTLIKAHGSPRAKTFDFAYGYGTMKCGECGHSLVAIEKVKYIKSEQTTKVYTLYLCSNKGKVTKCSQRDNVNEKIIEAQIEVELLKYSIDPEFLNWSLDVMKDNNFIEVITEKDIKDTLAKTLENKQEELKRLIQMATKGFLSDEEFKASRAELDKTISDLKIQLSETEGSKDKDLMELTEKAFVYSTYALTALGDGSKQMKKEVFKGLGLNRTITDKILNVRANDWYSEIRKGYFSIREKMNELEPEIRCKQKTIKDFDGLRLLLRERWGSNPRPLP